MNKIAIITDSSSGISPDIIKKTDDMFYLPIHYIINGIGEFADDESGLSNKKFYNYLSTKDISTSKINIGEITNLLNKIINDYDKILFLGLSKGLSSQHDLMKVISNDSLYKDKFIAIDTEAVSIILEKMVWFAHESIKQNKSIDYIIEGVNILKKSHHNFILVKTLETLKKGGRITPAAAALSKMMKIIPILEFTKKGEIDKKSKTRTWSKAIQKSLDKLKHSLISDSEPLYLVHANLPEEELKNVKKICENNEFKNIIIKQLPKVISVHTGPNTLILALLGEINNEN